MGRTGAGVPVGSPAAGVATLFEGWLLACGAPMVSGEAVGDAVTAANAVGWLVFIGVVGGVDTS